MIMKRWMFYLIGAVLFTGIIAACNKGNDDVEDCGEGWEIRYNDAFQAAIEAGQVYGMSGTREDCLKYVAAVEDYYDSLKDLEDCFILAGTQQQWRQALEEAEEDLDEIRMECN